MRADTTFVSDLSGNAFSFLTKYVTVLVLLVLLMLFSVIAPNFATPNNLIILLRQVSFTAISAVGIAFVMIAGGMDLSIGAQISLTNVLAAILMARTGRPPRRRHRVYVGAGHFSGRDQRLHQHSAQGTSSYYHLRHNDHL